MDVRVGKVTHYYTQLGVAVLELSDELKVGDLIAILGHTTEFTQTVTSMEVEHKKIQSAGRGDDVALKVLEPVRKGDAVYKVVEQP